MSKKIILIGGGTGGHVYPLLNLVKYLQKLPSTESQELSLWIGNNNSKLETQNSKLIIFHWIGESNSIESRVATENWIPFSTIITGKLRRYFSLKTLLLPFQVITGVIQSIVILHREKPGAIFSKGGYVSLPVALAGWILHIPVYLHESDSVPWLANRFVARFSKGIFSAFPEADSYFDKKKILGHGPLLSEEIMAIAASNPLLEGGKNSQNENRGILSWINPPSSQSSDLLEMPSEPSLPFKNEARTQILVSCGSQGSASIFEAVLQILETQNLKLKTLDWHIVLWVKNPDFRTKFEAFKNVHIYDFFYDQTEYLKVVQQCDVAIARSGSSIFEFEALGLHMIMIPHPHTGNNHQYWNALAFEKKGHELIPQEHVLEALPLILQKYTNFKKTPNVEADYTVYSKIADVLTCI